MTEANEHKISQTVYNLELKSNKLSERLDLIDSILGYRVKLWREEEYSGDSYRYIKVLTDTKLRLMNLPKENNEAIKYIFEFSEEGLSSRGRIPAERFAHRTMKREDFEKGLRGATHMLERSIRDDSSFYIGLNYRKGTKENLALAKSLLEEHLATPYNQS